MSVVQGLYSVDGENMKLKSKLPIRKAEGQPCEQGEAASRTGCIPAGGSSSSESVGNDQTNTHRIASEQEIAEAMSIYARDPITSKKISYLGAAVFNGTDIEKAGVAVGASDEHIEIAKLLTELIHNAPEVDVPVYRAVVFAGDEDRAPQLALKKILDEAAPGKEVTIDRIASFTSDRGYLGHYFSDEYHGEKISDRYELRLAVPHRSVGTDKYSGKSHKEYITQGHYEVVDVKQEKIDGKQVKVITLKQKTNKIEKSSFGKRKRTYIRFPSYRQ